MLNGEDHFAYVIGYEDGTVKPEGTITRAEVATIVFRLLKPEVRDGNLTTVNSFADVDESDWYNIRLSICTSRQIPHTRLQQIQNVFIQHEKTPISFYLGPRPICAHYRESTHDPQDISKFMSHS